MKKLSINFVIFLIVSCISLWAQDSNDELLNKLIEKNVLTKEEADQLRNTQNKSENKNIVEAGTEKVRSIFSNIPYIKIGGYGLLRYQYKEFANSHHNLDVRVVFLSVGGNITDQLSYFVLGELVDPMLYEYYATWAPVKEFNIRGGQFKVPFSIENPISLTTLETISNTRSISSLAGMTGDPIELTNGKNKAGRDLGVQISGSLINNGSHDLVQYFAGVFQGEGMNVSDKNNYKDFAGSLYIQPVKGFRFGGGVYAGQTTYTKAGQLDAKSHVRNRWGLSAEYTSDNFYARSEWIRANDGGIDKEGLYGTALWYFLPKKMNVIGKVDYYNQNKDIHSEVMDYTVGLNYYFYNQCRFQLNYTYSDYSKKWGKSYSGESLVQAQMQIVF